jgi:phospholipid-translocating ATPase
MCFFVSRNSDFVTISVNGELEKYRVLRVIEFSSERKRMSVTVQRESDGKIISFVKGADMAILPRINKGTEDQEMTESV